MSIGIEKLRKKLKFKRTRGLLRYEYYEEKQRAVDLGISTPDGLEWFSCINGWCTKAVDGLADRLQFDQFENDNFKFKEMFDQNNPDIFFDDAILSALITSCSFVYISKGAGEGRVRFQIIDGTNATGVLDDAHLFLSSTSPTQGDRSDIPEYQGRAWNTQRQP